MKSNDSILFSVIIPTYNRAKFIPTTLNSVLQQSYKNFELIIVDDGSTDNTEEIISRIKDPRITYYRIPNSERAIARNTGMSFSKGDYITFLDSDDLLFSNYLSNAVESIISFKSPPFLHLAYEIVDEMGKVLYKINNLESDNIKIIVSGNPLSCAGIFLRKDVSNKFQFNPDRNLSGSEDWELWLRVIANYGIKTDNRISAQLIHHNERSVLNIDEENLRKRKELAIKYAFEDEMVEKLFRNSFRKIDAFADSYISLHLALSGQLRKSLFYLFQSFMNYPPSLVNRRTLAIFKHLALNLFK